MGYYTWFLGLDSIFFYKILKNEFTTSCNLSSVTAIAMNDFSLHFISLRVLMNYFLLPWFEEDNNGHDGSDEAKWRDGRQEDSVSPEDRSGNHDHDQVPDSKNVRKKWQSIFFILNRDFGLSSKHAFQKLAYRAWTVRLFKLCHLSLKRTIL